MNFLEKLDMLKAAKGLNNHSLANHYPQLKGKSKKHKKEIKSRTKYHLTK